MKTLYTTICLVMMGMSSFAQYAAGDVHAAPAKTRKYTEHELQTLKDGVAMQNGRMFLVKNGTKESMLDVYTMLDGTKVLPDGTYLKLDGTKGKLQDGYQMLLSGELHKAPPMHYVTMKKGKMLVVSDTIEVILDRELSLENGNKIYPEGYMISEGKKVLLSNGDRVNISGEFMPPTPISVEDRAKEMEITSK